jgi:hypothetical protein
VKGGKVSDELLDPLAIDQQEVGVLHAKAQLRVVLKDDHAIAAETENQCLSKAIKKSLLEDQYDGNCQRE